MKSTIKLFLVVVLFSAASFADDGNMGNGGKTCTANCLVEGQNVETENNNTDQNEADKAVLDFIKGYLLSIFG